MLDNIHVLSHPLVNTRLAKLRQVSTTSKEFREVRPITFIRVNSVSEYMLQGIHELSIMLGYEASRNLEEETVQGVRTGIIDLARSRPLTDHCSKRR